MMLLRKILFPIVPAYYLITSFRNKLYDLNILKAKSFDIPVICVGNLSVGGTGKSTMIEYLFRLIQKEHRVAVLSRGYKRKTSGFILGVDGVKVEDLGDEPYQFKSKFSDILVAVDTDRQHGIEQLMSLKNSPDIILLDDGYQHRKVKAGLNILLTPFSKLYVDDFLLPTGDLRESKRGAKRADIVIVTKCPVGLKEEEKINIEKKLNLKRNQKLYYSSISYDESIYNNKSGKLLEKLKDQKFTLVTGIANSKPLVDYLTSKDFNFEHLNYKDHYNFKAKDIEKFRKRDLILTTEKDYMRLKDKVEASKLFYLPIRAEISNKDEFNEFIKQFVIKF
jgi:tetraacyldisaccharide 4'-kinase